ncbi:MAG: hypothetical protein FD169_1079 [Bacillota bacterium]|nr:MAG: hypothetical protein FD169_1079 [Bacillota bacterium]
MKKIHPALLLAIVVPLAVYMALHLCFGFYTGTNYDAYQYTYALREGPHLAREEFASTSRVFVHALYYFMLQPLVAWGLDAWSVFAWSSMLFSVLSGVLLYQAARQLGVGPWLALAATLLWGLSATGVYHSNIPEVYPMWLCALFVTMLALWHKRPKLATLFYVFSFLVYVQSILIVPMFLWLGIKRGLKWGTVAVALGFVALLLLLQATGVSFINHFAKERIYLEVARGDLEWVRTNVVALRQSGVIIPLLLVIPLALSYFTGAVFFLLLGLVPNLLFGLFWVKDQGAFLSPAAALTTLLFVYLAGKTKDYRPIVAVALIFTVPMFQYAWDEAAYDRSLGKVQFEFCLAAIEQMDGETPLVSTALFSRWLYAFSLKERNCKLIKYSPWAFVESQSAAMQTAKYELYPYDSPVYTDDSVHPAIVADLESELVFSHSGLLSNGSPAVLKLYRAVRRSKH